MTTKYRLVITITKHDMTGEALRRMIGVIGWDDLDDAKAAAHKYFQVAQHVMKLGEFRSYGVVNIVDEVTGVVHGTRSLRNKSGTK